jgi:acyl-coenzyme A thioesterase PaaI-like protein
MNVESMYVNSDPAVHHRISNPSHRGCIICGDNNACGMHLQFHQTSDGSATATFLLDAVYQGYPDVVHGGVVAAVLDGAMTHCLFAQKVEAVTAELTVRYIHPVCAHKPVFVRAWIIKSSSHLHMLAAELMQEDRIQVKAQAKFRSVKSTTAMCR